MKENDANVNRKARDGVRTGAGMILAGDVGGTKTLVGVFDGTTARPRALAVNAYPTLDHTSLASIVAAFAQDAALTMERVEAACFGVAGPVIGVTATLTNVPWGIDAHQFGVEFRVPRVALLNDLEAMAWAVPVLHQAELHVLQQGEALRGGHMALIAAGTGLGEAFIHNVGGRMIPSASEAGHADWAARGEREIDVLRSLLQRYGRAEVERVVSGRGLLNLHRVTHTTPCQLVTDDQDPDAPAAISAAALEGRCQRCVETLAIFVEAFGAEAGNLALRTLASGGLFVGGGIAPKILPALDDGHFMGAFRDKAPFERLLAQIPVKVILNQEAGLLGAAVRAGQMT